MDAHGARCWLLLLRTPGLGPATLRRWLVQHGHDPAAAWQELPGMPVLAASGRAWRRRPEQARIDADLAWLEQPGHRLLCFDEADFPPQLEAIEQAPVALFTVGDSGLLLLPQLAIVGARRASTGGCAHASHFATVLAGAGLVITSGMAEGIDGAAHQAALQAGHPTVAVVGTGPDRIYPARHAALARQIAGQGVLVSEFPPGTPPRADHFPRRNRLIAGLSLGTLVIEAGLQSGSLITARLAAEQGREVFALPGSIHNPLSRGGHQLIRDGARLVETPAEVLEAVVPAAQAQGASLAARLALPTDGVLRPEVAAVASDDEDGQLLAALGHDPVSLDQLVERCGLGASALAARLLLLELDGRIEVLPGQRYQRLDG